MKVVFTNSKKVGISIAQNAANGPWVLDEFGIELRERCHGAYRMFEKVPNVGMVPLRHDYFTAQMDAPLECFGGLTPRVAYLAFYQNWVLPTCGADALGKWLVRRVQFYVGQEAKHVPPSQRTRGMIIVDAGTPAECLPVIEAFGAQNCTVLQVGDFRLDIPGVDVVNFSLREGDLLPQLRSAAIGLFIEVPPPKEIVIAS